MKKGDISKLKIFLPVKLENFCDYIRCRAEEGKISYKQFEELCRRLKKLYMQNKNSIIDDTPYKKVNKESYYWRNTQIVNNCDVLYAFQVNKSKGTQDAIDKARKKGKPVFVKEYVISDKVFKK